MKLRSIFFLFIFFSSIGVSAQSAVYHIDPAMGSGQGNGSASSPFRDWTELPKMQIGDDVYFKCGTTFNPKKLLNIYWEGVESNPIVIGSYYISGGKAVYGVNGSRPIITGSNYTVPEQTSSMGLINVSSKDFIQIKNLIIYRSGCHSVNIAGNFAESNSAHFLIQNVQIDGAFNSGIIVQRNPNNFGVIENCEVTGCGFGWYSKAPGQFTWPGSISIAHCPYANLKIRGNYLHENWGEGIIIWRDGRTSANNSGYSLIEDNIIWNNRRVDIYIDSTNNNVVRRNLCLGANDSAFRSTSSDGRNWNQYGIWVNAETYNGNSNPPNNNEIYNNFIAGHFRGIGIGAEAQVGRMSGNVFYNNTIIGNRYNWSIGINFSNYTTSKFEFKNNVSYCPDDTLCEDVDRDPSWFDNKFIADYNGWTKKPYNFGGPNDQLANDKWTKKSGWQSLKSIPVAIDLMPTWGNPVIGSGVVLSNEYQSAISIKNTIYQLSPFIISVSTIQRVNSDNKWDMGAVPYQDAATLQAPNLSIIAEK